MLGFLLFRPAKNFFYDSWLVTPQADIYGLNFYLQSAFWLLLWCCLLIWAFTSRLRRGLRKEISNLAQGWDSPKPAEAVFGRLESECSRVRRFRQQLERLTQQVRTLRRRLALPDALHQQIQTAGVEVGLLLPPVGPEALAREAAAAAPAAQAGHRMAAAAWPIDPLADEEAGARLAVKGTAPIGTADRTDHGKPPDAGVPWGVERTVPAAPQAGRPTNKEIRSARGAPALTEAVGGGRWSGASARRRTDGHTLVGHFQMIYWLTPAAASSDRYPA